MSNVSKPTEVNAVTVHVHAASPTGDQPQPSLMLIAAKSIDVQHEYPLSTLADVYATEGITIASALCRTLPQGTTHQVLIALLQRQVTLLMPAAGWPTNAVAEMRMCAVCSKPVSDCICGDEEPPVPVREISLGGGAVAFVRETSDEAMLRDQRQAQARSDAEETTAAFRALPAATPQPLAAGNEWRCMSCGHTRVGSAGENRQPCKCGCACVVETARRVNVVWSWVIRSAEPDPRGGPFPPSTRGTQTNVGISPAALYEKAFRAGWTAYNDADDYCVGLAGALKKAGLA